MRICGILLHPVSLPGRFSAVTAGFQRQDRLAGDQLVVTEKLVKLKVAGVLLVDTSSAP